MPGEATRRRLSNLVGASSNDQGGDGADVSGASRRAGDRGVRAYVVTPGIVKTPLAAQIKDHPKWYAAYAGKSTLGH